MADGSVLPGLQEAAAEKFDQMLDIDRSSEIGHINVSKMLAEETKLNSRPYRSRTCDTLIRFNTLIFQALGLNRQNTIMEGKIQHGNSCKYARKGA